MTTPTEQFDATKRQMREIIRYEFFDTVKLDKDTQYLFEIPRGRRMDDGHLKDPLETNLRVPGRLRSENHEFLVQNMWCLIFRGKSILPIYEELWKQVYVKLLLGDACRDGSAASKPGAMGSCVYAEGHAFRFAHPAAYLEKLNPENYNELVEQLRAFSSMKVHDEEGNLIRADEQFTALVKTDVIDPDRSIMVCLEGELLRPYI